MFRKLTFITLLLALCVVIMGSYVRISDAGLGCPDWPGCYGKMIVDPAEIPGHQAADAVKAWKEMTHRYLAASLGILVMLLAGGVLRLGENRARAIVLTYGVLLLVAVQALLGMWAVKFHVMPMMVSAHLFAGCLTLWLLYRLFLTTGPQHRPHENVIGLLWLSRFGLVLLLAQILLGGWVSSNYAAAVQPSEGTQGS